MQMLFARHNVRLFRLVPSNRQKPRGNLGSGLESTGLTLSAVRRRSTEELDEDAAGAIEDPQDNPEVTMQNRQKTEILLNCLAQLSPAHREIIDLVYYHERSIDEVAEIVGVPQNTAKTRMFYARKRIAELMAALGIDRAIV
jgi:RNA polymerase sigma-70 factor, ECF subfamily